MLKNLAKTAKTVRTSILNMVTSGKSSHVGTALSCSDILTVLYFEVMKIDPKHPEDPNRDRFILSKGHGCAAQYAVLAERGFFSKKQLKTYYKRGGLLGHATYQMVPGMEASTGSLGHGLGIGVGMAYAGKMDAKSYRIFVVVGDGECNEGSIWEAALGAPQWKLDNLIVIVDANKIQGCGKTNDILNLEPFKKKWESFGWAVKEVDGHDLSELKASLKNVPFVSGKPSVLIAHTVKGKGVSFMENKVEWHYKSPDVDQHRQALGELTD